MTKSKDPAAHSRGDKSETDAGASAGRADQRARAAALPDDDDPVPDNVDEFRLALARKIMTLLGMHRRCGEGACRRHRRCSGADLRCQRDNPMPPMTPDQEAAALADVQRALQRHVEDAAR
jgi:hypothetical protein